MSYDHVSTPCQHEIVWTSQLMVIVGESKSRRIEIKMCSDCRTWFSLGAANDVVCSLAVLIEIRAADLAAAWNADTGVTGIADEDEARGWAGWPYRQPANHGEWAGFLAAQIVNHERDLGDVNWAGHHMADYDVEKEQR